MTLRGERGDQKKNERIRVRLARRTLEIGQEAGHPECLIPFALRTHRDLVSAGTIETVKPELGTEDCEDTNTVEA